MGIGEWILIVLIALVALGFVLLARGGESRG
jgi:Sec-independent protein translocase protein TatA